MRQEFKFTKASIGALPLPSSKLERVRYYDTVSRGLCLRLSGNGSRSFTYYRKINGKPFSVKLGDFPDLTVEQARGKSDELNARYARGEVLIEKLEPGSKELTLGQLFRIFIENHAKAKRKTWQVMEKDFERFGTELKEKRLSDITPLKAEAFHQRLGRERGTYAANRAVQLLKSVYNKGLTLKLYGGDNPFKGLELFPERPRERFLSNDEVKRLLSTLDVEAHEDLRDFVRLSLFVGARKSNLLSMRWADIDFAHSMWKIPDTKNGTSQTIALGENELAILKRRSRNGSNNASVFVFPGSGATGHIVDFKKAWTTIRKRCGLTDCTLHDLRRSLAAAMANSGANISLVRGVMHHKDLKTTVAVYAKSGKQAELDARRVVQNSWLANPSAESLPS